MFRRWENFSIVQFIVCWSGSEGLLSLGHILVLRQPRHWSDDSSRMNAISNFGSIVYISKVVVMQGHSHPFLDLICFYTHARAHVYKWRFFQVLPLFSVPRSLSIYFAPVFWFDKSAYSVLCRPTLLLPSQWSHSISLRAFHTPVSSRVLTNSMQGSPEP